MSKGQLFITIPDVYLERYGSTSSCRGCTYPRGDERSQPKGFFRGNTNNGLVLEIMVTKRFDRNGIAIKIDSVKKDGTQILDGHQQVCWQTRHSITQSLFIVMKRLAARGNLLRWRTEQVKASSSSSSALPIKQRNWRIYPPFQGLMTTFASNLKKWQNFLRHSDDLREASGAIK